MIRLSGNQDNIARIGEVFVAEIDQKLRIIAFGAMTGDLDVPGPLKQRERHEQVGLPGNL